MKPQAETGAPTLWGVGAFVFLLLVFGGLQSAWASRMGLWGGSPDFPLTLALCAALLSDAQTGAIAGFAAGWVSAALSGETLGTFLVSRILAGFLAGSLTARLYRGNVFVVVAGVWAASLLTSVLYALSAPPRGNLADWGRGLLVGAVWNALLSLPLAFALRRLGWGTAR